MYSFVPIVQFSKLTSFWKSSLKKSIFRNFETYSNGLEEIIFHSWKFSQHILNFCAKIVVRAKIEVLE